MPRALMRSDLWGDLHRIEHAALPSLGERVSDQLKLAKPTRSRSRACGRARKAAAQGPSTAPFRLRTLRSGVEAISRVGARAGALR
jgi:hypothetical protein